jgi:hypothetical protein
MLWGEATHINFIVFGLARLGLEPTIYCIRGQQAKYLSIDSSGVGFNNLDRPNQKVCL